MDTKRIAELLQPFLAGDVLSETQLEQVAQHLALLLKWNAKMNLTAVRGAEEMITRHFGESFFAATQLLRSGPGTVIDLGSGAGFPGLPMAIYCPRVKVTLIESQNKKATFLKEAVRMMGLTNVEVFNGRGEAYPTGGDLIILRAVEKFQDAANVAAGLVTDKGRLGLMISRAQTNRLPAGFTWDPEIEVPGGNARVVLVGHKNQDSKE